MNQPTDQKSSKDQASPGNTPQAQSHAPASGNVTTAAPNISGNKTAPIQDQPKPQPAQPAKVEPTPPASPVKV